jgi:hypothetical protein
MKKTWIRLKRRGRKKNGREVRRERIRGKEEEDLEGYLPRVLTPPQKNRKIQTGILQL